MGPCPAELVLNYHLVCAHFKMDHEVQQEDQTAALTAQSITEMSGLSILLMMGLKYICKINLI